MPEKLVIAISSRALFDLDESHRIFEAEGKDAYCRYQIAHEDEVLAPGYGFSLVKKFLAINQCEDGVPLVEIILLSHNSADTGLRIFNSIAHYGLDITRAAFTGGVSPFEYIPAFGAHLFLSTNSEDVIKALGAGFAAATILSGNSEKHGKAREQLRIAFDGDAVLFSDESERIYQQEGLVVFTENERNSAKIPLPGGPFKEFLSALHRIQAHFEPNSAPIRTALVTARSAPTHERVVRTLRAWNIRIDEALFLGGMPKAGFLNAFGADIFFDDHRSYCEAASDYVATAHVPHGIINDPPITDSA